MTDHSQSIEPDERGGAPGHRSVELQRTSLGHYEVRNARGGVISLGDGTGTDFTPVEVLLAAIAGCSSVDVDHMTSRRAEPEEFTVRCSGTKISDDDGNHLQDVEVTFHLRFPAGAEGDAARARIAPAIKASHDRECTVSRTVELPTPVTMRTAD
ncbi:OsmC family protein [Pseudactinotalea sp. Z1732]|uniref:OsmC family protein n=1 Tax=Micrococcales TaxID=85006 RepID=UPI003C7AE615